MTSGEPTFEDVDREIQNADLTRFLPGGASHITAQAAEASPADVIRQLCDVWKVAGKVVKLVALMPIPSKWKEALKILISSMGVICPARINNGSSAKL